VTWAKFGTELRGQLVNADLSDAAVRTHIEALLWLYEIESPELHIPKRGARTIFGSTDYEAAIAELVAARFWFDLGTACRYRMPAATGNAPPAVTSGAPVATPVATPRRRRQPAAATAGWAAPRWEPTARRCPP
jgi:hypothetical protein